MEEKLKKEFVLSVNTYKQKFSNGSRLYSIIYHTCLFGTTILTLLISFLIKADFFNGIFGLEKDDSISLIALIAAILSALIAKGGLDKKWKSFRINSGKMVGLQIDLLIEKPDYIKLKDEFKKIIMDHDLTVANSSIEILEDEIKNNET